MIESKNYNFIFRLVYKKKNNWLHQTFFIIFDFISSVLLKVNWENFCQTNVLCQRIVKKKVYHIKTSKIKKNLESPKDKTWIY